METVVLKADLEGSCRLKERKGDDTANPIISEVCAKLLKIIRAYTEICEAGAGDSIIAFFDSADKAVQASIEMQEHLAKRAQDNARPESPDKLFFRIALHSGDIKEMGETPLKTKGRVIDFTSRLEGVVDGGQVFVSRALKDGVSPDLLKKLDEVWGEGEAFHSYGDFEWEHFDKTEVFELLWHKGQEPKFGLFERYAEKVRKDWEKEKKKLRYLGDNKYIEPGLRKKVREPTGTNPDEYKPLKIRELLREKRAAIVADSGMGKSLLLKELQMRVDDERTPILFHFRDLDGVSTRDELYERIYDALYSLGFPKGAKVESIIEEWAKHNRLVFLIDGFDQVEKHNNYAKLLGRNSIFDGNTVIFTTRPWKYNMFESELSLEENYSRIELAKFSDRQIKLYLGGSYNRIASLFKGRRDLLGVPIILSLALELFGDADNETGPINIENRTDLYDHLRDRLLKREREIGGTAGIRLDDTRLRERFKEIAFEATARGFMGAFPKRIIGKLYPHISDDDFCHLLERGILCELVEGTPEKNERDFVEFRHQSFQEFLTALKMKELFDEGNFRLKDYAEYTRWDDTLAFLAGLLKDKAKPMIEEALKYDPLLAAKMWGGSKAGGEKLKKDIINHTENWGESRLSTISAMGDLNGLLNLLKDDYEAVGWGAANELGRLGDKEAIKPLIHILKDKNEDEDVRWRAALALGETGSDQAIDSLMRLLENKKENISVRLIIASTFADICLEETVEPLLRLLEDEDENEDVRSRVAYALGEIASAKAVEPLIQLLKNKNVDIRRRAAYVLGAIGSEAAVEPLINLLDNKDKGLRRSAAYALGDIGSEKAVTPLIQLLEDEDKDVRISAADASGEIGSEKAMAPLIRLLKEEDEDEEVRNRAAYALGGIGSEKAVEPLLEDKDENKDVRSNVAYVLGRIGSDKAVEPLIHLLKDKNVRWSAIDALGSISSEEAVQVLICLLDDKDEAVRRNAIDALGRTGSENAVALLVRMLKDKDTRGEAVSALGRIGSEKAVEPLLHMLENKNKGIRRGAINALGWTDSEKAVEPLMCLLKDKDEEVRWEAASALGMIGSEKVVEPLIRLLKDKDVCWDAAHALGKIVSRTYGSKKQSYIDIYLYLYDIMKSREDQETENNLRFLLNSIEKAAGRRFLDIKFPQAPSSEK